MTVKSALDGVQSILGIITKGDAEPSVKLTAIRKLAETLRNDLIDLGEDVYDSYIPEEVEVPVSFDEDDAIAKIHERLKKQEFNNLYAYYDIHAFEAADKRPYVRVAIAKALLLIAVEMQRVPNPAWEGIVTVNGVINEVEE